MPGFVKLASLDEVPPGAAIEVEHDGRVYAIFNVEGEIHVMDGICPHQGGPLAEGEVVDCVVTCPWHGWQFDIRTGQGLLSTRVKQPVFPVKIEGRDVLVEVP